ncbi:MAG: hypothetical protein FJW30_12595 [Acidobacteria bacterium]|nr:hypothetical protein [Acidobacteriota bacterium]
MNQGGVWRLEEAWGLLRSVPARSWNIWLAGTLPYTLALLEFLMDMSQSAYASERLAAKSLLLALLFGWKHTAQAIFTRDCARMLRGEKPAWPEAPALVRTFFVQLAWQPFRLPILLIVSPIVLPVPMVTAFFRNLGFCALENDRDIVKQAWASARVEARTQTIVLLVMALAWLLVLVNLASLWAVVPMLLKAFFGMQTDLIRLAARLFNMSTALLTLIVSFTLLEPVYNAMEAVRHFYAGARTDGEDLRRALRRLGALAALCLVMAIPGQAQVDPETLDRNIEQTLREPEFAWKADKDVDPAPAASWLRTIFDAIGDAFEWLGKLIEELFGKTPPPVRPPGLSWGANGELLKWAMIFVAALAVGVVVIMLLSRHKTVPPAVSAAAATAPDLGDDSASPEQRPEDEWLRLADECARSGDFRLAMRALHLAGLRYFGEKGWVTLQPAKTGMEYGRELARRLRESLVIDGYSNGLRQYELVWYGFGTADAETFMRLRTTWEDMRRHG